MSSIIPILYKRVKNEMAPLDGGSHSFKHVERVTKIAQHLAELENADVELVQVTALLHDIGRLYGSPHSEKGIEPARKILESLNYPVDRIERILWIIGNHNTETRDNLKTIEGKIVWDADKLDLIGFTGLSRYFHYAGEKGNSIESIVEWCKNRSEINPYKFNTNSAVILSESRIKTMKEFTRRYNEEISLSDYI